MPAQYRTSALQPRNAPTGRVRSPLPSPDAHTGRALTPHHGCPCYGDRLNARHARSLDSLTVRLRALRSVPQSPGLSRVFFREVVMSSAGQVVTVVYIHGAGNKPPGDELKRRWDQDLFGRDMGQRTRMAYYADVLHDRPETIGVDAGA